MRPMLNNFLDCSRKWRLTGVAFPPAVMLSHETGLVLSNCPVYVQGKDFGKNALTRRG